MSTDIAYVVTSGDYSAYGIERVFLDEDEAKAFVGTRKGVTIEQWPTNSAGYYVGQLYTACWQKKPKSTRNWLGMEPDWTNWSDDPAFPDDKVTTWRKWADYNGIRPKDIEVHGGAENRSFIAPEVAVMVVGYDKDRVEKALIDEVNRLKAMLLEVTP